MAMLSSHLLNGVDGTHAGNVAISLIKIEAAGTRLPVFQGVSDEGGRFKCDVSADSDAIYEMVISSGTYFDVREIPHNGMKIMSDIVIRFSTPDISANYHIPVIMSPNSYSCWLSS
ncbi:hydroxyisourate hydrolase [Alphaproteobacteria bacterium]|nr:hydroxyisourate hydrolase [Alphaproteobacteria bacterium]